ncbi:hypothetical protein Tco_0894920 [Tanacetum coccineum]|uniref:CCHC-type domain-containing protein n=1 Tax=Tanacetum coccineum TaxID=301880 RepID=A0ABQ5CEC2_9ASTR
MKQPLHNNNFILQPSFNMNYMQQPMPNLKDITDPITAMNMTLVLMAKAFKLNYSTPTNNNQRISSNPRNRQIAQPGINLGQDRQMQMVGGNGGNQFRRYVGHSIRNLRIGIANQNVNQNRNGNVVGARAEGKGNRNNGNQVRCYNCKRIGDLNEIEKVNANCILIANLLQESTSGTQTNKALVYDSDGSAKVHEYDNCYNNEIFNMFTQEEQYTELLEPIPEPHQVQQNDSNVISTISSVEQSGGTVEHHAIVEETTAKFVRDFKSLENEVNESLVKHKALEFKIKRLLRAVVSQDIMSIVQTPTIVESSDLQNELERVDNTVKTRRPQPRSNTKNDRVPSASKSSCIKNKEVEVEEHHRN